METRTGQVNVMVTALVQYRITGGTPFDIRVAGLVSMFDNLPDHARIQIIEQILKHEKTWQASEGR